MIYSKGISWINDTRIPFVNGGWGMRKNSKSEKKHNDYGHNKIDQIQNQQGRFPPNLLVSDDMLNDGSITGGKDFNITTKKNDTINWGFKDTNNRKVKQDKGSNSRYYDLDLWFKELLNKI